MSILFKPSGTLDVNTDPCDLPETTDGKSMITSIALAQCKNLSLEQSGVVKLRNGSTILDTTTTGLNRIIEQGGYRYNFARTSIYRNSSAIASGLTNAAWSAILYNSYNDTSQHVFCSNGTDRKRIDGTTVYEWGIEAPTVAPSIVAGALVGLTGTYNVKYTYCRKVGSTVVCESNPSPAAASFITFTNRSISITWTASSDSQVTHVRIYRTMTGGGTYFHDQDIAIGTVTLDSNTPDSALGSGVSSNHNRPPLGIDYLIGPNFNGVCFAAVNNLLYFCSPKQPEYWPLSYFLEIGPIQFPIQSIVFYNGVPYVLTKHEIYAIQGTSHDSFFPYKCNALTGCQGPDAVWSVLGQGIYHAGTDGIYLFNGSQDRKITQTGFDVIFKGVASGGLPGMSDPTKTWVITLKNKVFVGYCSVGNAYPTNVLVFNVDTGKVTYYEYDMQIRTVAIDAYNDRLLAGDSTGYVWVIDDSSTTTDNGSAISWELESKAFMLQTRAHFPRWVKYDIDASSSLSVMGYVYLEDSVHQSHAISGDRDVRKRLVATGNGQRMALHISGIGPVSIYAVEAE